MTHELSDPFSLRLGIRARVVDRLARNAAFSTGVYVLGSVSGLLLVPVLLEKLGPELFGLYVLALTTQSIAGLATGGLNRGFMRSIVTNSESDDPLSARLVVGTGVAFIGLFGLALGVVIWSLFPLLVLLFRVAPANTAGYAWILAGATIAYVLSLAGTPYQALLIARGRLDLTKTIEGANVLVGSGASAIAALSGWGLHGIAIAMMGVAFATSAVLYSTALAIDRPIAAALPSIHRPTLKELWSYGSRIQVVTLAGIVNRSVDRLTIGALRGPVFVPPYDVADRAAFSLVYTANSMADALSPHLVTQIARGDAEHLRGTYERASRIFSVAACVMGAFAVFNANVILRTWLGEATAVSTTALVVLALGYATLVSLSVANLVAASQKRPDLAMHFSVVQACANVGLSLGGAWLAGAVGAAIGSAISGAVGAVLLSVLVERRLLDLASFTGARSLLRGALVAFPIAALTGIAASTAFAVLGSGRLAGICVLGLGFAVQTGATILLAIATRTLDRDEVYRVLNRRNTRS